MNTDTNTDTNEKTEKRKIVYNKVYTKNKEVQDPNAFINAILDMREAIDNSGVDIIKTKLELYGTDFYLSTAELLHLALDEDFLKGAIEQENSKLDDIIKTETLLIEELHTDGFNPLSRVELWQTKAYLQQIQDHKKKIASLNDKLHGHDIEDKNDCSKITFTEEFANAIRETKEKIETTGLSLIIMDLKMKGISFDVTPAELLHFALDKNYLQREINRVNGLMSMEVSKLAEMREQGIDIAATTGDVQKVKIDLSNYNEQRKAMTSLKYDLYGPDLPNDKENGNVASQKASEKIFEKIRPATTKTHNK